MAKDRSLWNPFSWITPRTKFNELFPIIDIAGHKITCQNRQAIGM